MDTRNQSEQQLYAAQVDLLYGNSSIGSMVSLIGGSILALALFSQVPSLDLGLWYASLVTFVLVRFVLVRTYQRTGSPESRKWEYRFLASTGLIGLTWGCASLFLVRTSSIDHQLFIILVLAGMVAGGVAVFASRIQAFLAFALPILAPATIWFFTSSVRIQSAMGALALLFTAGMLATVVRANKAIRTSLLLRLDREELVSEIQEHREIEEALRHRIEMEAIATTASTRFIGLSSEEMDDAIHEVLRDMGAFCRVDRAYAFLLTGDGALLSNTHEWCAEGIDPQKDNLQELPVAEFAWWMDKLRTEDTIHIPNVAAMPKEAEAERAALEAQQIQSLVVVPLTLGNQEIGFLGFDSVRVQKTWTDEDIALLKMIGEVFVNALHRRRVEEESRELHAHIEAQQRLAAIGQLAAGIAHDFNNILMAMMGRAEIMLYDPRASKACLSSCQVILDQGRRAAQLIRQLLDYSRKSIIQPEPIELQTFLTECINLLQRTIPENVHFRLTSASPSHIISGDTAQLQQVFTNLATNARDAMPQGGELHIQLTSHTYGESNPPPLPVMPQGTWVCLSIADTGVGMTPDVLQRIYEPFFTTKEVGQGTGLGLSQVHGIVRQHAGFIDVQSKVGRGTTFLIYFPVIETGGEGVADSLSGGIAREHTDQVILLVEDDPIVQETTEYILGHLGYQVLIAGNGHEALQVYEEHASDIVLILTDMVMPGMGGVELLHAVHEHNDEVPIILMSGYPLTDQDETLVNHSLVRWLRKPVSIEQLRRALHELLD